MEATLATESRRARTEAPAATPTVSVVVIGRNEGPRLARCLASIGCARWDGIPHEVVYVDSRSGDDSVAIARSAGAEVLVLDDDAPCAAKARNLGWRRARGEFVLFLDGDTELDAGFVPQAMGVLGDRALCAVWGHRRESNPGQSLYTRVLDLDWVYAPGRTLYFGGDALVRRSALAEAGGFDPSLKAGEEPELCARLRAAGWQIEHIDAPMTRHDLAVTTLRAWWQRAYRSGIAYAEVADRMRRRGDPLWQRESARDFRHGLLFVASPLLFAAAVAAHLLAALAILAAAAALLARTAARCAWKAPGNALLAWQYAVFTYAQKVPALFGQLAWRRAQRRREEITVVDYKSGQRRTDTGRTRSIKRALVFLLVPVAAAWRRVVCDGWLRVWSHARMRAAIGTPVHPSNVVLGVVDVRGTGNIRIGRDAWIDRDVLLETQGAGRIDIGDGVVLSRGVHVVAFDRVTLGDGAMIGEYASVRDADHRRSAVSVRHSGHEHAPVRVGRNVWIGRGAAVLKGVALGEGCVVAANAVVTRPVPAGSVVAGVPARVLVRRVDSPAPASLLPGAPAASGTSPLPSAP